MATGLAYRIENRPVSDDHKPRAHAVAVCASCETEHALAMPRAVHNPEAMGERFRRHGFEMNPFKRASVRCPACVARHRRVKAIPSSAEVIPMTKPVPAVSPPGGAALAVPAELRAKVRELLTGTFDEQRGHYLDSYSDQRVAAECGVPMQVVREMREMWLGPIKDVPELAALQAELAALVERVARHASDGAEIGAQAQALKQRLDETRRQLGLAA